MPVVVENKKNKIYRDDDNKMVAAGCTLCRHKIDMEGYVHLSPCLMNIDPNRIHFPISCPDGEGYSK